MAALATPNKPSREAKADPPEAAAASAGVHGNLDALVNWINPPSKGAHIGIYALGSDLKTILVLEK